MSSHPERPHVAIPRPTSNAQLPVAPSPWAFEVTPPPYPDHLSNPWGDDDNPSPSTVRHRTQSMFDRTTGLHNGATMAFPEPQIYRSASQRVGPATNLSHRTSRSDHMSRENLLHLQRDPSSYSLVSTSSSYYDDHDPYTSESNESYEDAVSNDLSDDMAYLSLNSDEGIRRFQAGELSEKDQEWHKLVPSEALEALGKTEVQRQSVIFEVFKSEREYVSDLEAVQDVFITPLKNASPPIIRPNILPGFITEVFGNFHQILAHHQRMLGALFERQREQHPLIQSIADIVLDTTLKGDFRSSYETYIKHYPLSESHHRNELKSNPAYQSFIQSASADPRIRKRDLITFLSRPVTRLPRLNLLLEQILKLTDKEYEHPDLETLPIILGILSDCIKSTQPGIEAAESKVKFWALCESLVYQKGEIIDMDLYDKSRTLIYSGPVSRRARSDASFNGSWSRSSSSWTDLSAALLDSHFLLTREETRPNGVVKRLLMSRPLPLAYLRLGSFDSPPETRKEHPKDGSMLGGLLYQSTTIYPFTIYHAANKSSRRYTLYVASDGIRKKWKDFLMDTIAVFKARQEGNMYFAPHALTNRFFRVSGPRYNSEATLTGKISTAVPFTNDSRQFVAVGCPTGVYVAKRGDENYRKVLNIQPTSMAALQNLGKKTFSKLVVLASSSLLSYPLEMVALVALGQVDTKTLAKSVERVAPSDINVVFFRHLHVGPRVLIIYASKKLLQATLNLQVLEVVDTSESDITPIRESHGLRRGNSSSTITKSFRSFGDAAYVPKDAHDVTPLVKTIGVLAKGGIVIADPTNIASSRITIVPDLSDASNNLPMAKLKERLDTARPLGLVRSDASELLVVYNTVGCYITKHGAPTRSSGYIKWESEASAIAQRGVHLLLFSPQFIEIRHIVTGRLVQVIEGEDIRFLYGGPTPDCTDSILVAMKGDHNDKNGISEKILELVETKEIESSDVGLTPRTAVPAMWDEWDM